MGYMWATCGKPVDKNNVVWKTCGRKKRALNPTDCTHVEMERIFTDIFHMQKLN